ncbi:MAG TPA: hypothetical protein VFZ49_10035 [Pyrinomonadaceae bacterium]
MSTNVAPRLLARWSYSAAEWRRFGEYEGRHYVKLIKQSTTVIKVFAILTIVSLAAVPLFGILGIERWSWSFLGAAFLILLFGGSFTLLAVCVRSIQRSRLASLMADSGEVIITDKSISVSGIFTDWNYGDLLGNQFHDARLMTIKKNTPDELDLLEVRTIANTAGGHAGVAISRNVVKSCRVPIPKGKMREAELALEAILAGQRG